LLPSQSNAARTRSCDDVEFESEKRPSLLLTIVSCMMMILDVVVVAGLMMKYLTAEY
jgi:hypothetical protein